MANKRRPKRRLRFLPKKRKKQTRRKQTVRTNRNQTVNRQAVQTKKTVKRKKRRKLNRKLKIFLSIVLVLTVFLGFSNRKRLRLMIRGYSFHDAGLLIKSSNGDLSDYLSLKETINMGDWEEIENDGYYYDYYLLNKKFKDVAATVTYIDGFYTIYPELEELGYTLENCRPIMDKVSVSEFRLLVDQGVEYEKAKEYMDVPYSFIRDIEEYVKNEEGRPEEVVMSVSYANIDSRNTKDRSYVIKNPEESLTVVVKENYSLKQNYEPEDLVEVDALTSYDAKTPELREEAAKAFEKMASAAQKKDLYIGIQRAYMSYNDLSDLYDYNVKEHGYTEANNNCLYPGNSEHQLGLSVDVTTASLLNGYVSSFEDTDEYAWIKKNAHKYGFILRYPNSKSDITGISDAPEHLRYVGREAAQEMYEDKLTLEEYKIENGMDYKLIIQ